MSDWSAGYVADIGYTFGYYDELNPLRVKLAFLNNGLVCPEFGTACELGFGQGMSTNIHCAASVTQWYGTDFNPAQAGFAHNLALSAGTNAKLYDEAFAEFAQRDDLPDFDYICLHGIWSWISDDNRAVIVEFIRRRLKVGGILYISYNTLPGWATFAPIRKLMTEHAEIIGSEGRGIVSRIDGAIEFADKLLATNPLFSRANPLVGERIEQLKENNRHYLAHEYFNRDWDPMHFGTMAEWLEPAKLQYACSARYLDHLGGMNLTDEQIQFLEEIPDPMFRESVRDFMVNQNFRMDYWVKGLRQLNPLEKSEALRQLEVVLVRTRSNITFKATGALGESTMNTDVYDPILDILADLQPKSLGQIETAVRDNNISLAQILEVVMVLAGTGQLCAVQESSVINKARKHTDSLNTRLINLARGSDEISCLASPVTGSGIPVGRFQQLFLLALGDGKKLPADWAQFAWEILALLGQKIVKEGNTLDSAEDNLAELTAEATSFAENQLPVLKALHIV